MNKKLLHIIFFMESHNTYKTRIFMLVTDDKNVLRRMTPDNLMDMMPLIQYNSKITILGRTTVPMFNILYKKRIERLYFDYMARLTVHLERFSVITAYIYNTHILTKKKTLKFIGEM